MPKNVIRCARMRGEEDFKVPEARYTGDAGLDLSISRYACVSPGQDAHLSTNVAVAVPYGYFGMILPRSSTLWRKGLYVSPGVVDAGYRGEVMVVVRNMTGHNITILTGERIAQLVILPLWTGKVISVNELDAGSSRGDSGFGSTGGFSEE